MLEKYFNRDFEMIEFPYFVPKDEMDYNLEYAENIVNGQSIEKHWKADVERGDWKRYEAEAEKIASHGGLILEICVGPGGGFFPATLMKNYNANIMISDLCPTVVREWYNHFQKMNNPPPNIEYAAFNVCDMPFCDNCIDVVSGETAIINIEGDRDKALREIFRVLKPGGLFVFDYMYVTEEFYNTLPPHAQKSIRESYPTIFWDTLDIFDTLGFSKVEKVRTGTDSSDGDDGEIAKLCRSLNISLTYSCFTHFCIK